MLTTLSGVMVPGLQMKVKYHYHLQVLVHRPALVAQKDTPARHPQALVLQLKQHCFYRFKRQYFSNKRRSRWEYSEGGQMIVKECQKKKL